MSFWELMTGPVLAVVGMLLLVAWAPRGERWITLVWCVGIYLTGSLFFVYAMAQGWL